MRPPRFWQAGNDHPAARLLSPLAVFYGAFSARRMDRAGQRSPCPVICVGNFTLGGAGKTPAALAIAAILQDHGKAPVFLSRGYGGHLPGPVQVDREIHGFADVGDEPLLLARQAPVIVSRDRLAGAALCRHIGATAIVMDDGFQNPSLRKDLSLVLVDGVAGIGNGRVFPAGPLRVPISRQWRHVGGLILVGKGRAGEAVAADASRFRVPVHRARLVPEKVELHGRRCLAFAGIGRPDKFFTTAREAGAVLVGARAFPDHHAYRRADLSSLLEEARRHDAVLLTTEKDAVRLPPEFRELVEVLRVRLRFEDENALRSQVIASAKSAF